MITDKQLAESLVDGELAYISAEFWLNYTKPIGKLNPDDPVWEELRAFQAGWVACKQFYSINN